jgi:hypothetical protein
MLIGLKTFTLAIFKYDCHGAAPTSPLDQLNKELSADCDHRKARLTKREPEGCGAYFPDLEGPRHPPNLPPQPLRVIISAGVKPKAVKGEKQ